MSQLLYETSNPLPLELIYDIIYKFKGFQNKHSILINKFFENYLTDKKCFICKEGNVSLAKCDKTYVNYKSILEYKKGILDNTNETIWLCFNCAH